jgi:hypothetical protein
MKSNASSLNSSIETPDQEVNVDKLLASSAETLRTELGRLRNLIGHTVGTLKTKKPNWKREIREFQTVHDQLQTLESLAKCLV